MTEDERELQSMHSRLYTGDPEKEILLDLLEFLIKKLQEETSGA